MKREKRKLYLIQREHDRQIIAEFSSREAAEKEVEYQKSIGVLTVCVDEWFWMNFLREGRRRQWAEGSEY